MRDHFWVADMAGVDWAAELARYRPLVDAVGSADDLVDVLWEVNGELGTSHAYVSGRWRRRLVGTTRVAGRRPRTHRRRLAGGAGAAARDVGSGRAQPAGRAGCGRAGRRRASSRWAGGRSTRSWGPRRCWSGTANRLVELTVRTGPDRDGAGEVRRVVVKPLLVGVGSCATRTGWRAAGVRRRPLRGPAGLPARPRHGARAGWAQLHRDLGRETARDGLDPRRARQQRRPHLAAGGREAGPAGDRLGRAAAPSGRSPTPTTRPAARWSRWPTSTPARTATSSPPRSSGWASGRSSGPAPGAG